MHLVGFIIRIQLALIAAAPPGKGFPASRA